MSLAETCRGAYKQHPPLIKRPLDEIAAKRRVHSFDEFPIATQERYRLIASLFNGHQVYACGSRVTGHYLDLTDSHEVRRARRQAGKLKAESDWDFWVENSAQPNSTLPLWADRHRGGMHPNDMIAVPRRP